MALKLNQDLKQTLQTRLTPEQIQVIKMIELPNIELEERIIEELLSNPMLEEGKEEKKDQTDNNYESNDDLSDIYGNHNEDQDDGDSYDEADEIMGEGKIVNDYEGDPLLNDDFDYRQYIDDDEIPDYKLQTNNYSPDDDSISAPVVHREDFHDYLLRQLGEQHLSEEDRLIGEYVIGNIDERGYLLRTAEQMVDDLAFKNMYVSDETMLRIVDVVRHMEPAGIGAFDTQDCIKMQLYRRPQTEAVKLAITLVEKHMEDVSRHHFDRLQRRYNLTEEQLRLAINEIKTCTPKPSSTFDEDIYDSQRNQITPDFTVHVEEGALVISLVDGDFTPIRISENYLRIQANLLAKKSNKNRKQGLRFIKENTEKARSFIEAIRQRNDTLIRTMAAIVAFQKEYFQMGDDCFLRPMILEDIANITGLDPSTISRVSNKKYVQTDFGIIPLKHFFSEALKKDEGEKVSTKEVKKVLRNLIKNEDKRHPYTDEQLVKQLNDLHYQVARRTIAKYREQLGIPVTGQRKQLN